ncbi:MAG TPA: hypothetical protein PKA63_01085 [Oligoflexia bacterium]|nr:hypothetical protein [Oligoflexia bacterium]HMP47243.1 hypothetical protein [Oligoflexia bacterium]
MSQVENYLNQEEARVLAKVGLDTIIRYKDLGLLRVYDIGGEEKFSEEDIKLLFNSRISQAESSSMASSSSVKTSHISSKNETRNTEKGEAASIHSHPEDSELPKLSTIIKDKIIKTGSGKDEDKTCTEEAKILQNERKKSLIQNVSYLNEGSGKEESQNKDRLDHQSQGSQHSREVTALHDISSIELLELTRSLKDQLEIVKDERNWLRRRIEKLEAQVEREQMILISETETVRSMVLQREAIEKRKSPWAFLLSWTRPQEETDKSPLVK